MDTIIFKGDQNLAWDAVPTDYWLALSGNKTRFFIQDEKLGTPDFLVKTNDPFQITTDFCNKYKGIVWIHQDISYGPFYVLPIEPKYFKRWGFHVKHLDESFDEAVEKFDLFDSLVDLGIHWVKGRLPKSISESQNYFGIVPTEDVQKSISSYLLDENLVKAYARLFLKAYKGALWSVSAALRPEVIKRARLFHNNAKTFLKTGKDLTISDLQQFIWRFMWEECLYKPAPEIVKASDIFKLANTEVSNITLTTLLNHPQEFEQAYNEALKKAKLPLKRLKLDKQVMELPYFLQCDDDNEGLVRWRTKAIFSENNAKLAFYRGQNVKQFDIQKPFTNADIAKTISQMPCCISLIGKAGPLITELSRPPLTIALPEKGSKYTPMVGHLTKGLIKRGVDFPKGTILRIGMDALDRLDQVKGKLRLPSFLSCFYGEWVEGKWFTSNWRIEAKKSQNILDACHYHPTQLVSVARFILAELEGSLPSPMPQRLAKLGNIFGISKPVTKKTEIKLRQLMSARESILEIRRSQKKEFKDKAELVKIDKAISLIVAGVFKRHAQHADLFYLNRRPYAFSFWLCFGGEIVESMGRLATARIEEC